MAGHIRKRIDSKGKVTVDYLPDFLDHSSEIKIVEKKRVDGNVTPSNP